MFSINFKRIYRTFSNPVMIVNKKYRIKYINSQKNIINEAFFTDLNVSLKKGDIFSIFKFYEKDKFKIRKYFSDNYVDKPIMYLNYHEFNFYLKIASIGKNSYSFEFLPVTLIDDFMNNIYEENSRNILENKYFSESELNQIYERNSRITTFINIYNELSALFIECKTAQELYFVYNSMVSKLIKPESLDFLEIKGEQAKLIFSRNSVMGKNERISVKDIDYVIKSIDKIKKPLLLPNIKNEISTDELKVFPDIKSRTSAVFIPILKGSGIFGIVLLTFSSRMYKIDEYDLKILMGITNLAYMTSEKLRSFQEQKEIESRFDQQEKMIAMGNIIAGVAHEINNPLSIMQLDLDDLNSICSKCKWYTETNEILESLREEIQRLTSLVSQLKEYARPDNEYDNIEITDVAKVISNYPVKIFLKSMQKDGIKVITEITDKNEGNYKVKIPKNRLIQVIMNLLTNAGEALKNIQLPEKRIMIKLICDNNNLKLSVMDNGEGIHSDNLDSIFVPFFTTKKGDGTGLGLSISYSIIKKYSGELYLNKKNVEYTEFVIKLPLNK